MSFQTVLETALAQRIITPDMERILRDSLWSHRWSAQELNCLEVLTAKLEAGEIQIISA